MGNCTGMLKTSAMYAKGVWGKKVGICDGTHDEDEIEEALALVSSSETVLLLGSFTLHDTLYLPSKANIVVDGSHASFAFYKATGNAIQFDSSMDCIYKFGTIGVTHPDYDGSGSIVCVKPENAEPHDNGIWFVETVVEFSSLFCNVSGSSTTGLELDSGSGSILNSKFVGRLIGGGNSIGTAIKLDAPGATKATAYNIIEIGKVTATTALTNNSGNLNNNIIYDSIFHSTNMIFKNLPTSDPGVEGQLYNSSGTVKVSSG